MSVFRPLSPFTARNPLFFRGRLSIDHTQMKDRTRWIWLPASEGIEVGTSTLAKFGTTVADSYGGATLGLGGRLWCFAWPADHAFGSPIDIRVFWANTGTGTGNVVFKYKWGSNAGDGTTLDASWSVDTSYTDTTFAAAAQRHVLQVSMPDISISTNVGNPVAGGGFDLARFHFSRDTNDVADTLASDVCLIGVQYRYTADM